MKSVKPEMFRERYKNVFAGDEAWRSLESPAGETFKWGKDSLYVKQPPYFLKMAMKPAPIKDIKNARVLALLGDSITTDHISPAGAIKSDSPAGKYLVERGVDPKDFNSYGSRRGNHEVMVRGTFANIRLKNLMLPGVEGGMTKYFPEKGLPALPTGQAGGRQGKPSETTIFEAAMKYQERKVPVIVIAGKEYGTGSSRDWAAKGPALLGVKAVIAESFERIHRSNLVGMGILPLQFLDGKSAASLKLTGDETYSIEGIAEELSIGKVLTCKARDAQRAADKGKTFKVICRIDTPVELEYYRNGGILPCVLRQLLKP